MGFTITIGTWAIPAFITLTAIYVAHRIAPNPSHNDFGASGFIAAFQMMAALVVSLIAWLIWALIA